MAYLRDMLEHAREASALVQGKTRPDLDAVRMLNFSVVRLLEIVSEAASRVSEDERSRHRDGPWSEIVAMRNRLIHGYSQVNLDIVWQVVTQDLPPLITALERVVLTDLHE